MSNLSTKTENKPLWAAYGAMHGVPFSILGVGWIPIGIDDFGKTFEIFPFLVRDFPYMEIPNIFTLQSNMQ